MTKATANPKPGGKTKTYVFEMVIAEDPFDDDQMAYHAYCPSLKGAITWGYTKAEAFKNISEVVKMTIKSMIEHGEPIPEAPNGQSLSGRCVSVII